MFVISGATGRVGSNVVAELLRHDQPVRALARSEEALTHWSAQGAEAAAVDLLDTAALTRALQGAEGFFAMLPFNLSADDLDQYADTVIASVRTAVESAGVPHVVMLSSGGAQHEHATGPITGLHRMEQALHAATPLLTALRPGHFQEKFQDVLPVVVEEGVYPVFGAADEAKPMVATKDIGIFAARSLMNPPDASEPVDIIGPSYTERDVANAIAEQLQKDVEVVEIPEEAWESELERSGFSTGVAHSLAQMYCADNNGLLAPCASTALSAPTPLAETVSTVFQQRKEA